MSIVPLSTWYPAMHAQWERVRRRVPREEREAWVHHHTAGGTHSSPLAYARGVADFHWQKWRVPGGYAVLIGSDGIAREMSGLDYEGVHSGTHYWNRHGLGLAYQGDFGDAPPSDVMLDTAREVIASFPLAQSYHRAVRPTYTECPGDALIDLLPLETDMALTDEEIRRIWAFPTLTAGVSVQLALTRAERGVNELLLRSQRDAQAIADLVVAELGEDVAKDVADEIHSRLAG